MRHPRARRPPAGGAAGPWLARRGPVDHDRPRSSSGLLTTLSLVQTLLVLVGVVALAQKPANAWYRHRGEQRARGL